MADQQLPAEIAAWLDRMASRIRQIAEAAGISVTPEAIPDLLRQAVEQENSLIQELHEGASERAQLARQAITLMAYNVARVRAEREGGAGRIASFVNEETVARIRRELER